MRENDEMTGADCHDMTGDKRGQYLVRKRFGRTLTMLRSNCDSLAEIFVPRLERLADDLHVEGRVDEALALDNMVTDMVLDPLDRERDLVEELGPARIPLDSDVMTRLGTEQGALRKMTRAVHLSLRVISIGDLPARPNDFVIPSLVLCEFLRKHIDFKRGAIYPALAVAALSTPDLPALVSAARH